MIGAIGLLSIDVNHAIEAEGARLQPEGGVVGKPLAVGRATHTEFAPTPLVEISDQLHNVGVWTKEEKFNALTFYIDHDDFPKKAGVSKIGPAA